MSTLEYFFTKINRIMRKCRVKQAGIRVVPVFLFIV